MAGRNCFDVSIIDVEPSAGQSPASKNENRMKLTTRNATTILSSQRPKELSYDHKFS